MIARKAVALKSEGACGRAVSPIECNFGINNNNPDDIYRGIKP